MLPFCPLYCWLSSHPRCIKMLGLCFCVYVRCSQGPRTDPAKDIMPRACRHGQGLPSNLPKDSLCLHLLVIDCMFVVCKVFGMTLPKTACPGMPSWVRCSEIPNLRKGTDFLQTLDTSALLWCSQAWRKRTVLYSLASKFDPWVYSLFLRRMRPLGGWKSKGLDW